MSDTKERQLGEAISKGQQQLQEKQVSRKQVLGKTKDL